VLAETTLKSVGPNIKHGQYISYYKNGELREKGQYREDKKSGIWEEFYKNGQQKMTYQTQEDKRVYSQYWDKSGNTILIGGQGTLNQKNEERNELSITIFKDSLMYASYSVSLASNDTIYALATKSAEFKNGYPLLYKNIGKTMKYPTEARRKGIMGKVYVQFVVNEKGQLEDVKSIKGIGGGCDEEAEKAVKNSSGEWIPAEFEGKQVKSRMILPVSFKLN
jgi:TonB family protein